MAYPLGAESHAPRGVVNGLLLPHVMEHNIPVRLKKLARIAQFMGENIDGMSNREAAKSSVNAVSELIEDIGLPTRMRDIGVKESDIRPMAEATMGITRLLRGNPRKVNADNLEEIFTRSY
jgi:alcohol dehydrogenase class IV